MTRIPRKFGIIAALAAELLFFGIGAPAWPQAPDRAPAGNSIAIQTLSDTEGVDFRPYIESMSSKIKEQWLKRMPEEARMGEQAKMTVAISIMPSGDLSLEGVRIETGSGRRELDKAGALAIQNSVPFRPLPSNFHGASLRIRVSLFYNTLVPQKPN
jgi:TonB family protein